MEEEKILLRMIPRDVLFCRDARPMEDSWSGSGGNLPMPTTFHGAILAEYYRRFPGESALDKSKRASASLRTWGPFLEKDGELYFPTPLDVAPGNQLLEVRELTGESDLPKPLRYGLFASKASKEQVGKYISCTELNNYLNGKDFELAAESAFYDREARPGITISPKTRTVKEKGARYFAEYLRLRPGVSLAGAVGMKAGGSLEAMFDPEHRVLQLGGQQSVMYVCPQSGCGIELPELAISGNLVKWVLLTPTLWQRGWLPDFISDAPDREWNVLLVARSAERSPRREGESRADYRKRTTGTSIAARLVAARVGKPQVVSGWKMQSAGDGAPRATRLLVPAGSVYYFEARDKESASLLAQALHGRTLSNFGGTSGLGFGVCGNFKIENRKTVYI